MLTPMLKNIHPMLSADLLGHLQAMGHGDVLALVDRNYPAESSANRLVQLPGIDIPTAAEAIFSVLPVDTFVEPAVLRMGAVGDEETVQDVHADLQRIVDAAEGRAVPSAPSSGSSSTGGRRRPTSVATTEDRPYGCFLVTKGVV